MKNDKRTATIVFIITFIMFNSSLNLFSKSRKNSLSQYDYTMSVFVSGRLITGSNTACYLVFNEYAHVGMVSYSVGVDDAGCLIGFWEQSNDTVFFYPQTLMLFNEYNNDWNGNWSLDTFANYKEYKVDDMLNNPVYGWVYKFLIRGNTLVEVTDIKPCFPVLWKCKPTYKVYKLESKHNIFRKKK